MFKRIMMVIAVLSLSVGIACAAEVAKKNPVVEMETSLGKIKLELFEKEAPISVKNFLGYVTSGFYNDTTFHRVIPGFMIQGGGLTSKLVPKGGEKPPIKNEAGNGLKNTTGTLSMARSGDPESATAQFFINVNNNTFLDQRDKTVSGYGYAVFGKVIEGMDVVDKIVNTPQERKNSVFQNVPKVPVVIKSVKVLK
jgi:peptidyl-prolyl cis-trans isomerase A (cyclophilin A)